MTPAQWGCFVSAALFGALGAFGTRESIKSGDPKGFATSGVILFIALGLVLCTLSGCSSAKQATWADKPEAYRPSNPGAALWLRQKVSGVRK